MGLSLGGIVTAGSRDVFLPLLVMVVVTITLVLLTLLFISFTNIHMITGQVLTEHISVVHGLHVIVVDAILLLD